MRIVTSGLLALVLAAAAATPAPGQIVPGYEGNYDAAAAQFRAYALQNFQEVLSGWVQAVNEDRLEEALDLYAEDANVQLGRFGSSNRATRDAVAAWLEEVDGIQVGLGDFDASGSMSYGSVRIVINAARPENDTDGTLLFVLKRHGRDWQIRSQALVLD